MEWLRWLRWRWLTAREVEDSIETRVTRCETRLRPYDTRLNKLNELVLDLVRQIPLASDGERTFVEQMRDGLKAVATRTNNLVPRVDRLENRTTCLEGGLQSDRNHNQPILKDFPSRTAALEDRVTVLESHWTNTIPAAKDLALQVEALEGHVADLFEGRGRSTPKTARPTPGFVWRRCGLCNGWVPLYPPPFHSVGYDFKTWAGVCRTCAVPFIYAKDVLEKADDAFRLRPSEPRTKWATSLSDEWHAWLADALGDAEPPTDGSHS